MGVAADDDDAFDDLYPLSKLTLLLGGPLVALAVVVLGTSIIRRLDSW